MGDISKHYFRREIACKCGCGFEVMHPDTLEISDWVRDLVDYSITPSSGCRCPIYNRSEGSDDTSQHVKARGMDLPILRIDIEWVYEELCRRYKGKYGIIMYISNGNCFIHVDSRAIEYRDIQ